MVRKCKNTSRKGWSKEKQASRELSLDGWQRVFQSVRTRWATYDYADLFDLVFVKGKEHLYISCKHFGNSNNYLQHQQDIRNFAIEHALPSERYELWIWHHAKWTGRNPNKKWNEAHWDKLMLWWSK